MSSFRIFFFSLSLFLASSPIMSATESEEKGEVTVRGNISFSQPSEGKPEEESPLFLDNFVISGWEPVFSFLPIGDIVRFGSANHKTRELVKESLLCDRQVALATLMINSGSPSEFKAYFPELDFSKPISTLPPLLQAIERFHKTLRAAVDSALYEHIFDKSYFDLKVSLQPNSSPYGELEQFLRERNRPKLLNFIPLQISQLSSLKILSLPFYKLATLPSISTLTALEEINLSYNKLIYMPDLSNLKNLRKLDLRSNNLTRWPDGITQLPNLRTLDLSENKLTSIFNEGSQLSALTELDLSNNEISSMTKEITKLIALRKLKLDHNKLSTVPEEIDQLPKLSTLDLRDNLLVNLPQRLEVLRKTSCSIMLEGNPLKPIQGGYGYSFTFPWHS